MMNIEYEINRISSLLRVRSGGGVEKYGYGAGTELHVTELERGRSWIVHFQRVRGGDGVELFSRGGGGGEI